MCTVDYKRIGLSDAEFNTYQQFLAAYLPFMDVMSSFNPMQSNEINEFRVLSQLNNEFPIAGVEQSGKSYELSFSKNNVPNSQYELPVGYERTRMFNN